MKVTAYQTGTEKSRGINVFGGLNRYPYKSTNELSDTKNLSTDAYPYLTPRKSRGADETFNQIFVTGEDGEKTAQPVTSARAVIAPRAEDEIKGFCGVIGTDFYYNGEKKEMEVAATYDTDGKFQYGQAIAADGKMQLLWMNNYILIHGYDCSEREPYLYYYNLKGEKDCVQSPEYDSVSFFGEYTCSVSDKTGLGVIKTRHVKPYKRSGEYWDFRVGDSIFIDGLMVKSSSRYDKFGKYQIYDAVVTEIKDEASSTSGGDTTWYSTITFSCKNQDGENAIYYSNDYTVRHIYRRVPAMTAIAVKDGRIWGASPNGETIYASAFGDMFYFQSYAGTSADSAAIETATQGEFLGVYEYGGTLLAVKKTGLEVVYGNVPKEYVIGKSYEGCGCIDMDSMVTVGDGVFYLGYRGFYLYRGSRPQLISDSLASEYLEACAVSDGIRYLVSAKKADGSYEFLSYDPRYGIWLLEDDLKISGGFFREKGAYLLESGKQTLRCGWGTEKVSWSFTLKNLLEKKQQAAFSLWITAELEKGTTLCVCYKTDRGEWEQAEEITEKRTEMIPTVYYVPIRSWCGDVLSVRIEGEGGMILRRLEWDYDQAGKNYHK